MVKKIEIKTKSITVDQFLKWSGIADTGGMGKAMISSGQVKVNGTAEQRRSRLLYPNDRVEINGEELVVCKPLDS